MELPHAKAAPDKAADVWTWTALDSDSKLILSYFVGDRDGQHALAFTAELIKTYSEAPDVGPERKPKVRRSVIIEAEDPSEPWKLGI